MHNIGSMRIPTAAMLVALGLAVTGCEPSASGNVTPRQFILAVSSRAPTLQAKQVFVETMQFVLEKADLGDRVLVIDAGRLTTVAEFKVPSGDQYRRSAVRLRIFEQPRTALLKFLAYSNEGQAVEDNHVVRIPQLLDHLAKTISIDKGRVEIAVLGDSRYFDANEPGFSMRHGAYPSDAHLKAGRERSVFSVRELEGRLSGARLHILQWGEPWANDRHQAAVERFWNLYATGQGAQLATFTGDTHVLFRRLADPQAQALKIEPVLDAQDQKPVMLIARPREVGGENPAKEPTSAAVQRKKVEGKITVSLRGEGCAGCDISLYLKTRDSTEWLHFAATETAEGKFYGRDDRRGSQLDGSEHAELKGRRKLADVLIAVNLYGGRSASGARAALRVDVDGSTYEVKVHIPAEEGNKGMGFPDRMSNHTNWVAISGADIAAGRQSFGMQSGSAR